VKAKLLIVDDEPQIVEVIAKAFIPLGYQLFTATNGQEAMRIFQDEHIDLAILDYSLPDICGADLFRQMRAITPDFPVVFLTGYPNLATAVELMKNGVSDYIAKPFSLIELRSRIQGILKITRPEIGRSEHPRPENQEKWLPGGYIFGTSKTMLAVEAQIRNLSRYVHTTTLITGPTGTGKSAAARRIHELTCGTAAPFVEIDCSTIPHDLCESELFGHEKGSFTGAYRAKQGLFEAAGQGTAFLDEIGELDLALQTKLLHVLEARQFKRVGSHACVPMHARIIAATNKSLPELVRDGRFREDLYFRLNVFELWMPPLKNRGEDVIMLARRFLDHFAEHHQKRVVDFTREALTYLENCDFPGNIRELRNMIERAVISSNAAEIDFHDLVSLHTNSLKPVRTAEFSPAENLHRASAVSFSPPEKSNTFNLATVEREKLLQALASAEGNKSKAATLVGLSRTAFHRRLQKYQRAELSV